MKKKYLLPLLLCFLLQGVAQENYRNFYTQTSSETKTGLALVLANDTYEYSQDLKMAVTDGKHMVKALKEVGFDIEIGYNLEKTAMINAINDFAGKLSGYQYALVYYSGHGVQFDGANFLLPSDAKGRKKITLKNSAIAVSDLFDAIDNPGLPKIVVLDACRENPFYNQLPSETKSVQGQGLAKVNASKNAMIIYSTSLNTLVPDANQFTEIFSQNISNGGCISNIMRTTRQQILQQDDTQLIWSEEALLSDVCFGDTPTPPSFNDADGDGITDQKDQCPLQSGPLENNGCPAETVEIISMYKKGMTLYENKEYHKSFLAVKKAAEKGYVPAQSQLGNYYWSGLGISPNEEPYTYNNKFKDHKKAKYWYLKAAEQNDDEAQNSLGHYYKYSEEKNPAEANYWFKLAADNGNAVAMENLADSYWFGYGLKKDRKTAKMWLRKSCDLGNEDACKRI